MRRIALLATALACGLAPVCASAAVTRAKTILPPGESGFVRNLSGGGSPHRFDQLPLFVNFQWKRALFGQPGATQHPKAGVRIVRDGFGVPAITAGSDVDAWWGVGYAVAQDRLTELELFRRRATGRLAEVLGAGSLPDDIAARRDLHTGPELDAQVARLPAALRVRLAAYRDGINAWIRHVRADPSDLPVEFSLLGVPLRNWKVRDTAAIGALLVRQVPRDDGRELQNAHALRGLGKAKFQRIVPLHVLGSPLIVPRSEGAFPSQPGRTTQDENVAIDRSSAFVAGLALPPPPPSPRRSRVTLGQAAGSLAVAARRGSGAVLFSGPQLGFAFPELFWEVEVHRPGLDVRGVTAPGAPVVAVGYNRHVAWGLTSGESDADDLYAERLAGRPEEYLFDGTTRTMACRNERFFFKSGPSMQSTTRRLCRTLHGPVQERAGNFAYARRYATFGRELETLVALDKLDRASDVAAVDLAMRKSTWNENVTAADDAGHLGFWHPGLLPLRPRRWDERLPFPGTGEAEWRGFLSVDQRPHVIDPARGWLANWNNQPSAAWTNGDASARARLDGPLNRATFLYPLVKTFAKDPSLEKLEPLIHRAGTVAQQRPLVTGRLQAALNGSVGRARIVLATLLAWDGSYARHRGDGTVNPGVATWETFKLAAQEIAGDRLGPGFDQVDGENAAYHFFDASNGVAFALRTLSAADYRAAAAATFSTLAQRFGTTDAKRWREPRHLYPWTLQGAASPPDLPFFDRGTWEQLVELK